MGGSSGGGGGKGGSAVPIYQYGNMPTADYNATAAISNLYNDPQNQQIYNQAQGSLGGIPQYNTGYNPANVTQQGINVQDASAGLPYMAQQIGAAGFDPQGALFQRMQQQITDQTNSSLAQQGLQGSPFAQGIMGQNLASLDANWQQQALDRMIKSAESASGLVNQFGKSQQQSAALQQAGPQSQMDVSNFLSGLNATRLSQAQQAITDWLGYLQGGTQASSAAAQEQMALNDQELKAHQMNNERAMGIAKMAIGGAQSLMGGMRGKA